MKNNRIKICFYNHDAQMYGASRSLLNLLQGIQLIGGYELLVITPEEGSLNMELNKLGIRNKVIFHPRWVTHSALGKGWKVKSLKQKERITRYVKAIFFLPKHIQVIKEFNPDVIYSNSSVIFYGLLISKLLRIKHIWHIREFKDLDHSLHLDFGNKVFYKMLSESDLVISISNAVKDYINKNTNIEQQVIYNGICTVDEYLKRRERYLSFNRDSDKFIFSILGYISESKGQITALNGFRQLSKNYSNVELQIAGAGNKDYLMTEMKKLGLNNSNVKILGHVDDTESIYLESNCILVCSTNEAFGRVSVEAMSYGIPVIGYANMGTCEIITDLKSGLLFGNGYPILEHQMERIIQDRVSTSELGENGWQSSKLRFNTEKYSRKISDHIQNIMVN